MTEYRFKAYYTHTISKRLEVYSVLFPLHPINLKLNFSRENFVNGVIHFWVCTQHVIGAIIRQEIQSFCHCNLVLVNSIKTSTSKDKEHVCFTQI